MSVQFRTWRMFLHILFFFPRRSMSLLDYQRPPTLSDSVGCGVGHDSVPSGARFRQIGHDSVIVPKVPHFPAESCPTSQRSVAPLQMESAPHFDRNPQANPSRTVSAKLGALETAAEA